MTCAFAVRGAIRKFSGVESVEVSLNKGLATVKLKPGNTIRPEELWEASKFKVAGTNQVFDLVHGDALAKASGETLVVEAKLTPGKDLKAVPLQIVRIAEGLAPKPSKKTKAAPCNKAKAGPSSA